MGIYSRFILPTLLDRSMRRAVLDGPRRRTLRSAYGRILEIGFGSGANLPFYPGHIGELTVVEPDGRIMKKAWSGVREAGVTIHAHRGTAEAMPFVDEHFDTVVSTLTLCSVEDPDAALGEIRRVLKKGGQFLFLEHGLSADPSVARWQHRLNGFNACIGGGCQLTRNVAALVQSSGMEVELRSYYLPETPRIGGYMVEGRAFKTAQSAFAKEAA